MTYRDAILGPLDAVRSVGGLLGLRIFTVTVRLRTYAGQQPGQAPFSDVDTTLVNQLPNGGTTPVHVRTVTRREVIASGGLYTDRDLRIGPITPSYIAGIYGAAGGFDSATVDPAVHPNDAAQEVFWHVTAPPGLGYPTTGMWCDKISEEFTALHVYVILRATGRQP